MGRQSVVRAAVAGLAYVGSVFAVGFALGTLRVLVLVPRLGETVGVLLELPVLLTLAWKACHWLTVRFDVPTTISDRFVMGGLAFAVLMLAELGGSMFGFGRTLTEHLQQYSRLAGVLGLAGQIAFAAFPAIQSIIENRRNTS